MDHYLTTTSPRHQDKNDDEQTENAKFQLPAAAAAALQLKASALLSCRADLELRNLSLEVKLEQTHFLAPQRTAVAGSSKPCRREHRPEITRQRTGRKDQDAPRKMDSDGENCP